MTNQSLADKLKDLSLGLTTGRYGQIKVVEKLDSLAEELRASSARSETAPLLPGLKAALGIAEGYLSDNDAIRFLRNDIKDAINKELANGRA